MSDRYRVELPPQSLPPHPDLHAAAIWYVLSPFVGSKLELSFPVSRWFADIMREQTGVTFKKVADIAPRVAPENPRPTLLFSGGTDSLAASLLLPPETVILVLDRIPRAEEPSMIPRPIIEMTETRALCGQMRRNGRDVLAVHEDHEALFQPYPVWHSEMSRLLPLYLADTFATSGFETGDVLDVFGLGGYHDGSAREWVLRPCVAALPAKTKDQRGLGGEQAPAIQAGRRGGAEGLHGFLGSLGLVKHSSLAGLSEIATSKTSAAPSK